MAGQVPLADGGGSRISRWVRLHLAPEQGLRGAQNEIFRQSFGEGFAFSRVDHSA